MPEKPRECTKYELYLALGGFYPVIRDYERDDDIKYGINPMGLSYNKNPQSKEDIGFFNEQNSFENHPFLVQFNLYYILYVTYIIQHIYITYYM